MVAQAAVLLFACDPSDNRKQPAPSNRPWPAPNHPSVLIFANREKNDLRATNDVFEWNVTDSAAPGWRRHPAVGRIVAIVAHHEIFAIGHHIDISVVPGSLVHKIQGRVAHPVGQGFPPALDA